MLRQAQHDDQFFSFPLFRNKSINFEGKHDQFPAYELLVDNVRKRRWDPVANGQLGPNPINLHANYWHTQVRTSHTIYQRLPYGYKQQRKRSPFGL